MSLFDDINIIARGCGVDVLGYAMRALEPRDPQQPRNRTSFAPVEGSSPTDDAGTVGVVDPNDERPQLCSCGARVACRCGPIVDNE